MRLLGLHKSDKPDKKYYVELDTGSGRTKRVYFGAFGMNDFTTYSPLEREKHKKAYIERHKVSEDWNNPETAGFWAKHILWNKPSVHASLLDTKHRFNL